VHPAEALKSSKSYPTIQNGEGTIAQRTAESTKCGMLFYSSWFCPYAQRAWAVLEELQDQGVKYRYVPVNPFQPGSDDRVLVLQDLKELYSVFVDVSPRGRVPALNHNGILVSDFGSGPSCVQYLYTQFKALLPLRSEDSGAALKFWEFVDNNVVDPFRRALAAQDKQTQERELAVLTTGLREVNNMMQAQSASGFFLGEDRYSFADVALAPFWQRLDSVLQHHRGFQTPQDLARLHNWWVAVSSRPSFRRTMVSSQRLVSLPASGTFAWTRVSAGAE